MICNLLQRWVLFLSSGYVGYPMRQYQDLKKAGLKRRWRGFQVLLKNSFAVFKGEISGHGACSRAFKFVDLG